MTNILQVNPNVTSSALFGNQAEQRSKNGREYLVVPGVPVREQVMNTYLLPAEEIQQYINVWNGTPVSIGHAQANGGSVKVPEPDVPIIGSLFNVEWDSENKRMLAEYWIDIAEAMQHNDGKTILDNIRNGKMIETSTAYWADEEFTVGNFNGKDYKSVHRNTRPDHIAVFVNDILGACSIEDGCGVNRNMRHNSGDCGCGYGTKQNTALPPFQKGHLPTEILIKFAFDTGYRTPEELDKTNSYVEKNGITKPVWIQCKSNGDYKILDGAHRIQLAHVYDYDQVPVQAVDEDLNSIDLETIYYQWEHDMDRSYLNSSTLRADHGKPKKKKRKFVYKGKTFKFSDLIWQFGGKGSGHHGHKGRPGQEGGSSKGLSGKAMGDAARRRLDNPEDSVPGEMEVGTYAERHQKRMKNDPDYAKENKPKVSAKLQKVNNEYNRLDSMTTKQLREEHKKVFKDRRDHSGDKTTLIEEIFREKFSASDINDWMDWSEDQED